MSIEAQLVRPCSRCDGTGYYRRGSLSLIQCSCPAGKMTAAVDVFVSRIEPHRARIAIVEVKSSGGRI